MDKIKVGIIGFGFMGHNHADMVKSFDEISSLLCAGAARVGVARLEAMRRMEGWEQPAKAEAALLISDSP